MSKKFKYPVNCPEDLFRAWYTEVTKRLSNKIVLSDNDRDTQSLCHELKRIAYWYGEISSGNYTHFKLFVEDVYAILD